MVADLFTRGSAIMSTCGRYRYLLRRTWDEPLPHALFVMLNPSTADAEADDPTIRRCIGFARSWGLGGIRVVNLFAFRATRPEDLWRAEKPAGHGNNDWIGAEAYKARIDAAPVVCAWGVLPRGETADSAALETIRATGATPQCLGTTKDGFPAHPLYLAADTPLRPYEGRSGARRGATGDADAAPPPAGASPPLHEDGD